MDPKHKKKGNVRSQPSPTSGGDKTHFTKEDVEHRPCDKVEGNHIQAVSVDSNPPKNIEIGPDSNDEEDLHALQMTTVATPAGESDTSGTTEWLCFTLSQRRVFAIPGFPKPSMKTMGPPAYEVRSTPDMGMGVFATRDIKAGELILAERPLLIVPAGITNLGTSADGLTDDEHMQLMVDEWESMFSLLVDRMSPENKAALMDLSNSHVDDGSGRITGIIRTNGYGVNELDEDLAGPFEDIFCGYSAIGRIGSRFNHSCIPNILRRFDLPSFSLVFTASRDIQAGAQIFTVYCTLEQGIAGRKADLEPYGVVCKCPACVHATPARDRFRGEFYQRTLEHFRQGLAWEKEDNIPVTSADFRAVLEFQRMAVEEGLDRTMFYMQILTMVMIVYKKLGLEKKADELFALAKATVALCGVTT